MTVVISGGRPGRVSVRVGPQPMDVLRRIAEVGRAHDLSPRCALMMWAWACTADGKRFMKS